MSMTGLDPDRSTAENYRAFAAQEAAGRSPAYRRLALAVADDAGLLAFLTALPDARQRQPNLFFGVARVLLRGVPEPGELQELVAARPDELRAMLRTRRTQTNEAGRCALLLPALAQLPEPLALIEVGASAGLTLLPDRWSYDYSLTDGSHHRIAGTVADAPVMRCAVTGPAPLPECVPEVVWRAGLDLHPLDVADDTDVAWLQALVWPGQTEREERLTAALSVARRDPPRLVRGDLLDDLAGLVAEAPAGATVVVYHSAVLAYVQLERRRAFARLVADLGVVWLSNEGRRVLPDVPSPPDDRGGFVLVRDGRQPLAVADGHAAWLDWLG